MARTKRVLAIGSALSAALLASSVGAAYADYAPSGADLVGVGSDTVQNIGNFVADGDNAGDGGYNSAGNINKMVSFNATPDENDRAGFAFNSTPNALVGLNPTIVLRAGLSPVQRPNGSGSGITALLNDKGAVKNIDFVRSSRLPSSAEYNNAAAAGGTGAIRAIKISTDDLIAATATSTNAPAGLTAAQLADIYDCTTTNWSALGGTAGTIVPVIPQTGSGTRSAFLANLLAAKPSFVLGTTCGIVTAEENDPAVLAGDPNRIAPFSAGRINLYASGYFKSPAAAYCSGASCPSNPGLTSGIKRNDNGGTSYKNTRGLYIIVREADGAGGAAFQPGGAASKVQDLFYSTNPAITPFVNTQSGAATIAAAGATPTYVVCGVAATTC